jgi:polyisoprenoid-binding protein YceI
MARYVVDAGQSRLTVKAFASGMLSSFGHNPTLALRDFDGEARFTPESPGDAALTFRVRPAAFDVTGDVKASDRRDIERETKDTVLETAKFPEVVFASHRVTAMQAGEGSYRVEVSGKLNLHGVSRDLSVPAQVSLMGDTLRAFGEVAVSQTQFGIRPTSAMGGALKVKDEVKLTFEIVARRQSGDGEE